jgi:hypothetical protein
LFNKSIVMNAGFTTCVAIGTGCSWIPTNHCTHIENKRHFIPNYGERWWRYGEAIATGSVESTVNQVVNNRFCKRQRMQ